MDEKCKKLWHMSCSDLLFLGNAFTIPSQGPFIMFLHQKPSYEAWGGQPGYFRIYYKVHTTSKGNSSRSNYTLQSMNNTQLNMTVLTGLQSGLNYDIYMVMCNTAGKCGPRGLEYTIKALPTGDQPGMNLESTLCHSTCLCSPTSQAQFE